MNINISNHLINHTDQNGLLMADSGSLIIRFVALAINSRSILIQTDNNVVSARVRGSRIVDMFSRPINHEQKE